MRKRVLIISPMLLPIPAISGGAIETLITSLLEMNEIKKSVEFVVIAPKTGDRIKANYKYSKIIITDSRNVEADYTFLEQICWQAYQLWCKLRRNKIAQRIKPSSHEAASRFSFWCFLKAIQYRANVVVNEGYAYEWQFGLMNYAVGYNNNFTHIHFSREENARARNTVRNSISISEYVQQKWVIDSSIMGKNSVVYNGINLELFTQKQSIYLTNQLKKELGCEEDDIVVIFCGRIMPEKGIKQLLDAFELLMNERVKLLLIGSFDFSRNTKTVYSEEMQRKAEMLKNVIPLGYIPNEKMPLYYSISDIQVVPSVWQEGAGLVCIEGMASGLPLIVTNSGGMVEYVDEKTSIKLEIDDDLSINLANAIVKLSQDFGRRMSMSVEAKKRASQFSAEKYYDNYIDTLIY